MDINLGDFSKSTGSEQSGKTANNQTAHGGIKIKNTIVLLYGGMGKVANRGRDFLSNACYSESSMVGVSAPLVLDCHGLRPRNDDKCEIAASLYGASW